MWTERDNADAEAAWGKWFDEFWAEIMKAYK
jgi:hypothetical protein